MDRSPRGREIIYVEGRPSEIVSRGNEIKNLGEKMRNSAEVLEDIKTRASENQGEAIEALRESIGDSYKTLFEAADLYEPVGPVISTYGEELGSIQPVIKRHVDDCESLWSTYESLPGDKDRPGGAAGAMRQAGMSDEAREEEAEEDEAKQQAYDEWKTEAELFDGAYDTWENAFDNAVEGIGEEMAGSIEDSFWDDWGDFITEFLSWASLVLGVAALIIGGPIVAALAALAALAFLAVTIYEYSEGNKSLLDVGLAALGILPIGKLGNLFKALHFNGAAFKAIGKSSLGNFGKLKGLFSKPALGDGLIKTFQNRGAGSMFTHLLTGSPRGFTSVYRSHKAFYEGADAGLAAMRNSTSVRNLALLDFGSSFASNALGHYGRAASATQLTPMPDLPSAPKWTSVF
ncbi:hypothetical protein [Georgenia deserti]|uniref:WXG100 family type VII secretion target n=1 Tax=Georgenia deserti TaxID=2093781 RepID=A0ABW4L2J1_9MICO